MIDLSQETEALALRVAAARRVSVDSAVRQALEASAHAAGFLGPGARDLSAEAVARRRTRMEQMVGEIATLPIFDRRSPRDIMDDLNAL